MEWLILILGADALYTSLEKNKLITHLDVGENKVSEKYLKKIEEKVIITL